LANQGFAFLKQVAGGRAAGVQGFEVLAQLAQLCADVQEQAQDAPVCGVVAVMLRVALHLWARGHGADASACSYGHGASQALRHAPCSLDLTPLNTLI